MTHRACALAALIAAAGALCSCSSAPKHAANGVIAVVAAENFYADVAAKIGGSDVSVTSILSNPNTDPHSYESNTADANAVAGAQLVVQNGLGYDAFMNTLEGASPNGSRRVIVAGALMRKKMGANPHLWYDPQTMPRVAAAITQNFCRLAPKRCSTFQKNNRTFVATLKPWQRAIAKLAAQAPNAPIAVTEPVFNYTASAIGLRNRTPRAFALAIEEGNDPAPQDVQTQRILLQTHAVKVLIYNQQTVEPTTTRILELAQTAGVPVVGVYETMPRGFTYATWMKAEVDAVAAAILRGRSTQALQ